MSRAAEIIDASSVVARVVRLTVSGITTWAPGTNFTLSCVCIYAVSLPVVQEESPIHGLLLGNKRAFREASSHILDSSNLRSFEGTIIVAGRQRLMFMTRMALLTQVAFVFLQVHENTSLRLSKHRLMFRDSRGLRASEGTCIRW